MHFFGKKHTEINNRPKTSAAEAKGQLLKSFGIGQLRSASVILCSEDKEAIYLKQGHLAMSKILFNSDSLAFFLSSLVYTLLFFCTASNNGIIFF